MQSKEEKLKSGLHSGVLLFSSIESKISIKERKAILLNEMNIDENIDEHYLPQLITNALELASYIGQNNIGGEVLKRVSKKYTYKQSNS